MPLLTGTKRALFRQERAWSVRFYQENDGIVFGSGANIDDLFLADCTIEFYIRGLPGAAIYYPITKTNGAIALGWLIFARTNGSLGLRTNFSVTDSLTNIATILDNKWHHIAWDWDVGTLTGRAFADGVLTDSSTAVGVYQADLAQDCLVNAYLAIGIGDGACSIGPIRLSNTRRYTGTSFNPPTMNHWPFNDANAQLITRMNDAAGATVTDYSGNSYDGTITFGANTRWYYGRV